jgi:hypothetical protein
MENHIFCIQNTYTPHLRYTEAVALDPTEGKVPAKYNVKEADEFLGGASGKRELFN